MNLSDIFARIKGRKVLVIGDIMLDHYVIGDATRISPEAPVPVVAVEEENYSLGAAANVALNILSLGGSADLCGMIGTDSAGTRIRNILLGHRIGLDPCFINQNVDTIVKTRIVARGQQLCRVDREAKKLNYMIGSSECLKYLEAHVRDSDAVILSDYNKGALDSSNVNLFISWAKKYNIFIALDPKPANNLQCSDLDLLTPNKQEAYELAGHEFDPDRAPLEAVCRDIDKQHHPKNLIITLGGGGMLLSTHGAIDELIPTYAREVFDVSGAGDTVIAALTLALSCGISARDAMRFANYAAGVVVGKSGTAIASPAEIMAFEKK